MSFTSQYFNIGQQALTGGYTSDMVFSMNENNRQLTCLCSDLPGKQTEPCYLPGIENTNCCGERLSDSVVLAQPIFNMKNARKQQGEIAQPDVAPVYPNNTLTDNLDSFFPVENPLFLENSMKRVPESPEIESFRSWLKMNLPTHKASPALIERIRKISEGHHE